MVTSATRYAEPFARSDLLVFSWIAVALMIRSARTFGIDQVGDAPLGRATCDPGLGAGGQHHLPGALCIRRIVGLGSGLVRSRARLLCGSIRGFARPLKETHSGRTPAAAAVLPASFTIGRRTARVNLRSSGVLDDDPLDDVGHVLPHLSIVDSSRP